jgi:hypothetical protein
MMFITEVCHRSDSLISLVKYRKILILRCGGAKWGVLMNCEELAKQEGMDN